MMMYFFFLVYCLVFGFSGVLGEKNDGVQVHFELKDSYYAVDAKIGSNSDNVSLLIDTWSDRSIVIGDDVECGKYSLSVAEAGNEDYCKTFGSFDVDSSSTSSRIASANFTTKGVRTVGELVEDTFKIGDESFDDFPFVVANSTQEAMGTLGLGLGNSSNSIISAMKEKGVIDKSMFSFTANDNNGRLVFGKFDDTYDLKTFSAKDDNFVLPLEHIDVLGKPVDLNMNAVLDIGVAYTHIPYDQFNKIFKVLDANIDVTDREGTFIVPCDESGTFRFDFDGVTLEMDLSDLTRKTYGNNCSLSLVTSGKNDLILGQDVLKNAYLVFDLEEEEVSIAPKDTKGTNASGSSGSSNAIGYSGSDEDSDSSDSNDSSTTSESTESSESDESADSTDSTNSTSTSSDSTSSPASESSTSDSPGSKVVPSSLLALIGLLCSI